MRQKVAKHEGQVIEWKARRSPHGTDNRALLLGDTPAHRAYAICGLFRR
ncbi:hypothetical protein NBRC3255_3223 [Gluconobacter thailandicus NBRC 3255]|nr:hypothetical protein NBRC3255_3223 [Gluconobacter thailandicus NBRC 3255]